MAVNYVVPVHYKTKSGKWVEYDNSLVKENVETSSNEEEIKYSNKKSNIDVDISTILSFPFLWYVFIIYY